MESNKKQLQEWLNQALTTTYGELLTLYKVASNKQRSVLSLVMECCELPNLEAIGMTFDRVVGKVAKPVEVRVVRTRYLYVNATAKELTPPPAPPQQAQIDYDDDADQEVIVPEEMLPSDFLLRELERVGMMTKEETNAVLDDRNNHQVATVMCANLYTALSHSKSGVRMGAIRLLFDRFDGAVADKVLISAGDDLIRLPNYAQVAPYNAKKNSKGYYYLDL